MATKKIEKFLVKYNSLREEAKKRERWTDKEFEPLKKDIEDIRYLRYKEGINDSIMYIYSSLLQHLQAEGKFVFGETKLADKSKLFFEDNEVLVRKFHCRYKNKIDFFSNYNNKIDVFAKIVSASFFKLLTKVNACITEFNLFIDQNVNSHKTVYDKHVRVPIYAKEGYGGLIYVRMDVVSVKVEWNSRYRQFDITCRNSDETKIYFENNISPLIDNKFYSELKKAVNGAKKWVGILKKKEKTTIDRINHIIRESEYGKLLATRYI